MTSQAYRGLAHLMALPTATESRGVLAVAEMPVDLPFEVRRVFTVTGVPPHVRRAQHANRRCDEMLLMAAGACTVELDDGETVEITRLTAPSDALFVRAGLWLTCSDFTSDAVLVVLAALPYDPADQITDHAEFLTFARSTR